MAALPTGGTHPVEARVSLSGEQLKALARQGAAQRYQELQEEMAALVATFPELRRGGGRGRGRRAGATPAAGTRRGRTMTAAQRKEVSERMSRYWAARRAEKEAAGGGAGTAKKARRKKAAKKAEE